MDLHQGDRLCIPVPLYHCIGMVIGNLAAINYGAAMVLPSESFDPAVTLKTISKHQCTLVYGVPTMFISYLEEYQKSKYDISSLKKGYIGGSSLSEALNHRIHDELGIENLT